MVLPINSVMSPVVTCEGESRCCKSVQVWMTEWQQLWCSEGKVASLLDVQWWSMMYKGWIHSKEGFNISPCLMLVRIWVWYANFPQHCHIDSCQSVQAAFCGIPSFDGGRWQVVNPKMLRAPVSVELIVKGVKGYRLSCSEPFVYVPAK